MPDYTTILKRSIEGVPDHTSDMRRAIYERARSTISRQLTSVDPPLSAQQIELQHQKLEQAISDVEAEYAFVEFDPAEFEAEIGLNQPPEDEPEYRRDAETDDRQDTAGGVEAEQPVYQQPAASIDFGTSSGGYAENIPPVDIRPSRAPLMIVLGLLLLAGVGAGVLGYRYQDQVTAFVDDLTEPEAPVQIEQAADAEPASAADESEIVTGKSEERLGGARDELPVTELRGSEPGETIEPKFESVTVDQGATQPSAAADAGQPEISQPAAGFDAPADPVVTGAAGPANVETTVDTVGINEQRAIFYTQGSENTPGQASQGSVTWSRIDRPDGLPAIQAQITLADPEMDVVITISKNTDVELPASHLIEVTFDGVPNLAGAAIDKIPALVIKSSEQARGQPLAGANVPVTESLFWIALSDEAEQVASNLATLRDGTWFDMPLLFKDQKRALITFEKGGQGEALFKEVLAAWASS